jgi:anti-sigma factor RsiW
VNPEVPDELSDLVDRLLEKNPRRRYGSAAEVENLLAGLLARRPSLIRHDGRRQTVRRWVRSNRRRIVRTSWVLAAVAAIGLVVGLATLGVLPDWFHRGAPTVQSGAGAASRHGERVINPTVNEGVVTDLSVLRELSAVALDAQTSDVEKRLRQLEGNPPRQFYQSGQTDWPEEVNGIQRELSRLEQPAEFLPNPNGEKR